MSLLIAKNMLLFLFVTLFCFEDILAANFFNKLFTHKNEGKNTKELEEIFSKFTVDQPLIKASYEKFDEKKYTTICWNEKATLHFFENGTNYGYIEYSISLEASPKLAPTNSIARDKETYEITDNDTKESRKLDFVTVEQTIIETIKQNLTFICRSGKILSKSFIDLPERKRVEIKLKPVFQNVQAGTTNRKETSRSGKQAIEVRILPKSTVERRGEKNLNLTQKTTFLQKQNVSAGPRSLPQYQKENLNTSQTEHTFSTRIFSPNLNNTQDLNSQLKAIEENGALVGTRVKSTNDANKNKSNETTAKSGQDLEITMLPRMLFTNKSIMQENSNIQGTEPTPSSVSKISPRILPNNENLQQETLSKIIKKLENSNSLRAPNSQQESALISSKIISQSQDLPPKNKSQTVKIESASKPLNGTDNNKSNGNVTNFLPSLEAPSKILQNLELNSSFAKISKPVAKKTKESLPSSKVNISPRIVPQSQNLQKSVSQLEPGNTAKSSSSSDKKKILPKILPEGQNGQQSKSQLKPGEKTESLTNYGIKITSRILPTNQTTQQSSFQLESQSKTESLPSSEKKILPRILSNNQSMPQPNSQLKSEKITPSSDTVELPKNQNADQVKSDSKVAATFQSKQKNITKIPKVDEIKTQPRNLQLENLQTSHQKELNRPSATSPEILPQTQNLTIKESIVDLKTSKGDSDRVKSKMMSKNEADKNKPNESTAKSLPNLKSVSETKTSLKNENLEQEKSTPQKNMITPTPRILTENENLHREKSNISLVLTSNQKNHLTAKAPTSPEENIGENSVKTISPKLLEQNKRLEEENTSDTPDKKIDAYSVLPRSLLDYIKSIKNKIANFKLTRNDKSQHSDKDKLSEKTETDETLSARMMPLSSSDLESYENDVPDVMSIPNNYREFEIGDPMREGMLEGFDSQQKLPLQYNKFLKNGLGFEQQTGEQGYVGKQFLGCKNGKVTVKLNMDILNGNSKVKNIAKEIELDINHHTEDRNKDFDYQLKNLIHNYFGNDLYMTNCVENEDPSLDIAAMPRTLQDNQEQQITDLNLPHTVQQQQYYEEPQNSHLGLGNVPDGENVNYASRPFYAISPYNQIKTFYVDKTGVYHVVPYSYQPKQPSLFQRLTNNIKTVLNKLTPTNRYSYV